VKGYLQGLSKKSCRRKLKKTVLQTVSERLKIFLKRGLKKAVLKTVIERIFSLACNLTTEYTGPLGKWVVCEKSPMGLNSRFE